MSMASEERCPWKRFWCPWEKSISFADDGFVFDPESEYGILMNPALITLESVAASPCAILLGEPGLGKSDALREHQAKLASHSDVPTPQVMFIDQVILQRAKEKYLEAKPRIISDNGPQFIARDFKEFIRISGMTHVRTSPYYPQSNGKIERWHKSLKGECIRPGTPLSLEDARRLVEGYVEHYNNVRLHSAIGYVTPHDMLVGRQAEIHAARDRKLEEARHQRQLRRAAVSTLAHSSNATTMTSPGETEAGSAGMQPC